MIGMMGQSRQEVRKTHINLSAGEAYALTFAMRGRYCGGGSIYVSIVFGCFCLTDVLSVPKVIN